MNSAELIKMNSGQAIQNFAWATSPQVALAESRPFIA